MKNMIEDKFDIFVILDTKLDNSLPNSNFSINGYRMFQHDRNCFRGGLCLYVKHSIACNHLSSHKKNRDMKVIYLEINRR